MALRKILVVSAALDVGVQSGSLGLLSVLHLPMYKSCPKREWT